jgi:exonuclease III
MVTHAPETKAIGQMQNRMSLDSTLHVGTINTNGLAVAAKRLAIPDTKLDVIGLTETHLQSHLHVAYSEQWKNYHCFYSPDLDSKHYNGVALLLNKSKFWKASKISWPTENSCHKFAAAGRLIAVHAWIGHGGSSILFYNLYAPSGSRWEAHKRRQLHQS